MVQFNWYCARVGDNDEALTWGRNFKITSFFPKMSKDVLHFSFSLSALADVFENNEKKNKTTSAYRLRQYIACVAGAWKKWSSERTGAREGDTIVTPTTCMRLLRRPREIRSEERASKFHADDASQPTSG